MKYLIAILLPEPISQKIRQLQLKYKSERWNIRVSPHITLIFRGDLLGSEGDLMAKLTAVAEGRKPFEITLEGIDIFNKQLKVVFARVKTSPQLLQLQSDLVNAIQSLFVGDDNYSIPSEYHPHVTISNRLTEEEMKSVLTNLKQHPINHTFICQNFSLLKRAPKELTWKEVRTFSLQP